MQNSFLGHEVVRQILIVLQGFSPAPRGDWGWFLRKITDICVKAMRHLVVTYYRNPQLRTSMDRAQTLVRLYVEEAFHRVLYHTDSPILRQAYCSLMVSMRDLELSALPYEGFFTTFNEDFVRRLGAAVHRNEGTTLENLASYPSVMLFPELRVEIFSLMSVRIAPNTIAMNHAEIKALIEANGSSLEPGEATEGHEGPSVFADLFADEDNQAARST